MADLDEAASDALRLMRIGNPDADPASRMPDVHPARIPRHIAIIMDGNGRWAKQRGFHRLFGHRNGAAALRPIIEECRLLGVRYLTLYSFSLENWRRPEPEVGGLMLLYLAYLEGERERLVRDNIRFVQIGRREGLPEDVLRGVDRLMSETSRNTGPTLCVAINYGGRAEITDAVRTIASKVKNGEVSPDLIDESVVANNLYTAGMPDPDLLIRTAGESRISNFLLWQISYAEIHITQTLWPDFGVPSLHAAIRDYAARERRFGGLNSTSGSESA